MPLFEETSPQPFSSASPKSAALKAEPSVRVPPVTSILLSVSGESAFKVNPPAEMPSDNLAGAVIVRSMVAEVKSLDVTPSDHS